MAHNDNDLAARAAAGDAQAFQLLLERHYDLFYRVAWRYARNDQDAEDIAQDICLSLASKIKSFRGEARFSTWVYRVTINASQDFLRKQASSNKRQQEFAQTTILLFAANKERREQRSWMYEMLEQIGDPLRETALLVLAEGLSHRQVGDILGVKESTISWRMHELRKKLKEQAAIENE